MDNVSRSERSRKAAPLSPATVPAGSPPPSQRQKISISAGIAETQEMLDLCAEHAIVSDIELIRIQDINQAYERLLKGDV